MSQEKERKFVILKNDDIIETTKAIRFRNVLIGGTSIKNITKEVFPSQISLDNIKETIIGIYNFEEKLPEYFLS
jgi:hypothetical protein